MVKVEGSLVICRRSGSRGSFSVGDLVTSIGEFKVKDAILDQFEPGEYRGEFVIKWIQPTTFAWRGRVSVENRATLADIVVHSITDANDDVPTQTPPERDPVDEKTEPVVAQRASVLVHVPPAPAPVAAEGAHALDASLDLLNEDAVLFGDEVFALFCRRLRVKLDPTVDRELFRRQCKRLKASGYAFDSKPQAWNFAEAEETV